MTNDEFQAWLQGYVFLTQDLPLDNHQIFIIKNHANLVKEIDGKLTFDNQMLINHLESGIHLGKYIKREQKNA